MLACKWDTDKQSLCSDFRTRKNKTILLARKKIPACICVCLLYKFRKGDDKEQNYFIG